MLSKYFSYKIAFVLTKLKICMKRKSFVFVILLALCSITFAQQRQITGTVTDKSDGTLLPGVNVLVENSSNGVTTDADGKYSITVQGNNTVLVFKFIGYSDQKISVGNQSVINVQMGNSTTALDEVVVTALGMKREKKTLGYAMQELNSEKLSSTKDPSIAGALEGKVAGVQVDRGAGGLGASSKITIRGNSSISRSNEPLWIVDGVPLNDSQFGSGGEWGGIDIAGGAQDINPENIETLSVLKGPNAAALYGSRAANGVILVTTKKGVKRKGIGVSYNGSFVFDKVNDIFEYQTKYSQGKGGKFLSTAEGSWGEEMKGQTVTNWRNPSEKYVLEAHDDRLEDYYRTGYSQSNNVSFYGGGDKFTARVSIGHNKDRGVYDKLEMEKYDFSTRVNGKISDLIEIDAKVNYIRATGENRPENGIYGATYQWMKTPLSIRPEDLQPAIDEDGNHVNFITANDNRRNPYFLIHQRNNNDEKHRLIGKLGVKFNISKDFNVKVSQGLDFFTLRKERRRLLDSNSADKGGYNVSQNNFREENTELMLTYNKKIEKIGFTLTAGANRMYTKSESIYSNSGKLALDGYFFTNNGTNKSTGTGYSEKELQSVFGLAQFSYDNFLFVDVTGRNDWSSTLPSDNRSYFYPSITTSVIVSELVKSLPEQITFLKLRGGYSVVGNDTSPYRLENLYSLGNKYKKVTYAVSPANKALSGLKPEKTKSYEFGLDLKMFNNRLGVDLTYYNGATYNQILRISTPMSSGYNTEQINAGKITNKGFELMVYGTPIKTKDITWDLTFNYSKNEGFVDEMDDNLKEKSLGGMSIASVYAIEGEKFGQIKGKAYLRNDQGQVLVNKDNGLPIIDNEKQVVGNITPDFISSLRSDLRYKGISFGMQFKAKIGGDIISNTESVLAAYGNAKITENREEFAFAGVYEDGTVNTTKITPEAFYSYVGDRNGVAEEFKYDASYIKLQEISLGYNIPQSVLKLTKVITSAKFSLVARNLGYLLKHTPGSPEGYYTRSIGAQATDYAGIPNTRTYGFNISVKF